MQGEHNAVKWDNKGNEVRRADRVWEAGEKHKWMICADIKDMEIYEE